MALACSESNTEPLLLLRREGLPTCVQGERPVGQAKERMTLPPEGRGVAEWSVL